MDNSVFKKAKRSFLWVLSSSVVFQIVNWLMTILVVRILTPTDYGMFGLLMIAMEYLGPLTHCNLSSWYVWKDELSEKEECTVELAIIGFSTFLFIVVFIFAPVFANFFNHNELTNDFRLISTLFLLTGVNQISLMKLEREINFKPTAIINVFLRLFQGVTTLTFAIHGFGYKSLVYSMFITAIIRTGALIKLRPPVLLKQRKLVVFEWSAFKSSFNFGINITLGMFFWIVYSNSDNLIIGKVFGAETLGFYSLAFFFIDLPLSKLNEWIRPVLHPYFSRLKNDKDTLNTIFLRMVFIYLAILGPIFSGILAVADDFVFFVLGKQWQGAVPFLKLLALVGLMRAIADLIAPYLIGIGQPRYDKYYNAAGAILLPVSFYCASILFGIKGIMYVWLFIYPVIPLMMLFFFKKFSGVSLFEYIWNIMPQIISCFLMYLVVLLVNKIILHGEQSLIGFIIQIIAGAISYGFLMIVFFKHRILEARKVFHP